MQEFQYETASVRAQLTEAASASKMELDDLTRKLAETELDAERHKQAFLDEAQRQQQVIEDVGKKLADKRGDYDELKLKYKTKEKVRKRWEWTRHIEVDNKSLCQRQWNVIFIDSLATPLPALPSPAESHPHPLPLIRNYRVQRRT